MIDRPLFPLEARVRLSHDVERYPHFIAPAGALGTVVDVGDPRVYAVRLDEPVAGAEDWENEVHWLNEDDERDAHPRDDLELVVAPPVTLAVGMAGWGACDANGVWLADGYDTADDARRAALALGVGDDDLVLDFLSRGERARVEAAAVVKPATPAELVLAALPQGQATPLELVEAADRALAGVPGYPGSVPEGREFVADVLRGRLTRSDAVATARAIAEWLVAELTLDTDAGALIERDEQERAYEIASADVVLTLTHDDAEAIADALEMLAGVDEGENTDYDALVRLAYVVRGALEVQS